MDSPRETFIRRGDFDPARPFSAAASNSCRWGPVIRRRPSVPGAERLPIDATNGFPLPGPGEYALAGVAANNKSRTVEDWEKKTGLKRDDYFATIPCLPIAYDT